LAHRSFLFFYSFWPVATKHTSHLSYKKGNQKK
jgi:hypothetical protein